MIKLEKTYSQTPIGVGKYVYLNQPDVGNGTFTMDPTYKVTLELAPEVAETEITKIKSFQDKAVQEKVRVVGVNKQIKKAELPFSKNESGNFEFKFKLKQNGIRKSDGKSFTQSPKVFDNQGRAWDMSQNIYSGSTMRINYELIPYESPSDGVGVSLRLKDAQIQTLSDTAGSPFANQSIADDVFDNEYKNHIKDSNGSSLPSDELIKDKKVNN